MNKELEHIAISEAYNLPLKISEYRFTLRAIEPLCLPDFVGSMLRGSFGWALKGLICITKAEKCDGCVLYAGCQYPKLFSPKPNEHLAKKFPSIPAPYLFKPLLNTPLVIKQEEIFHFDLTLFGDNAISQLALIILAWQRAAAKGLGKGKAATELIKVEHLNNTAKTQIYEPNSLVHPHDATIRLKPSIRIDSITLELLTPTRIQHGNKLLSSHELTASIFLNTLQRKVLLYATCYLGLTFEKLQLVEETQLEAKLTRRSFHRYSNRQKQKMNLEGLVGNITLTGNLTDWWPLIQLGQYTHVGKNTSFGLGRYQITHVNRVPLHQEF